jgi:hypothetical protein
LFVKPRIWYGLGNRQKRVLVRACDEQAVSPVDDGPSDPRNLCRCLALSVNDFRKTLTDCPVMVDASETEILDRVGLQRLERAPLGFGGVEAAVAYGLEQSAKRLGARRYGFWRRGHNLKSRGEACADCAFDSALNPSIELTIVPSLRPPIL